MLSNKKSSGVPDTNVHKDMKTICNCSPALWFIFAAPFWVILLRKVPVNNELALIIMTDMESGYYNKYLFRHILD